MKFLRKTIQPIRTPWLVLAINPISQFAIVLAAESLATKILAGITFFGSVLIAYELWPVTPKTQTFNDDWLDELDAPIYRQLLAEKIRNEKS